MSGVVKTCPAKGLPERLGRQYAVQLHTVGAARQEVEIIVGEHVSVVAVNSHSQCPNKLVGGHVHCIFTRCTGDFQIHLRLAERCVLGRLKEGYNDVKKEVEKKLD